MKRPRRASDRTCRFLRQDEAHRPDRCAPGQPTSRSGKARAPAEPRVRGSEGPKDELVEPDEVRTRGSLCSTRRTRRPAAAASRAIPAPLLMPQRNGEIQIGNATLIPYRASMEGSPVAAQGASKVLFASP